MSGKRPPSTGSAYTKTTMYTHSHSIETVN